jgi:hypothetical protein
MNIWPAANMNFLVPGLRLKLLVQTYRICNTMKYSALIKQNVVQIRIEPELTALIEEAVERMGLSKSELLRQGLRKGIPEVVRALGGAPKRTLVDALREMKGLEIPERSSGMKY